MVIKRQHKISLTLNFQKILINADSIKTLIESGLNL